MTAVEQIKTAIQNLSVEQRRELAADLPKLMRELDGDAEWERVIHDPAPRPALTAMIEKAQAELRGGGGGLIELTDEELDREP